MKRLLLLCFVSAAALSQTSLSVLLTWVAPTTNTDGTPISGALTYNIYQYGNAAWTKVGSSSTTSYTVSAGLTSGQSYNFHVTAVNAAGLEGPASATVTKVFPATPPAAPTGLTAK